MTATAQQHQATGSPRPAPAPAAAPGLPKPKPDPRYLALRNFALSMSVFNVFGYTVLGFEQPWLWPILSVLIAYAADMGFEMIRSWAYQREPRFRGNGLRGVYEFLLPAHITALAVTMLTYANNQYWPVAFGVLVGVGAKHILQAPVYGKMRHFMNPSNLGITAVLLCFPSWASIAPPYEFTENANSYFRFMIPIIILTAGTVLNTMLTKKVPLILGWMGAFAIQAFVRHWIWDVSLWSALSLMTSVAFILFTNYMVTDPGTTPVRGRNQFMFGSSVAFVYGILMVFQVVYTLFFAVCIVCLARGLGWWAVHWLKAARERRAAGTMAEPAPDAAEVVAA